MLPLPKKYFLTAASCEGETELTAFDGALLKARVGNTNLLKVSSILPPGCQYDPELIIPEGSLLPIAYGTIICSEPGTRIAAAVAVGGGGGRLRNDDDEEEDKVMDDEEEEVVVEEGLIQNNSQATFHSHVQFDHL